MTTTQRLAAGIALTMASIASAHTPYLAPNDFTPDAGDTVTLDAAFTETLLTADVAFDNDAYAVIAPDGSRHKPDLVKPLTRRTIISHQLPKTDGTYRFSTGLRHGAAFRSWEINGKKHSSRNADVDIPHGAQLLDSFQSLTLAETYVSVGQPDRGALHAHGHGLEFVPVTHPNDLYVGERFEFIVQYDGKPVANQTVDFIEAVWTSDRKAEQVSLKSDADGRVKFTLIAAGTWLARARYCTDAADSAPVASYSNTYTLTFQVLGQ